MRSYPVRLDNDYLSEPPPPPLSSTYSITGLVGSSIYLYMVMRKRFNSNMYMYCVVKFHMSQRLNILPRTCTLSLGLRVNVYRQISFQTPT